MGIEIKLDMQAIKAIEDAAVKSAEVAMEQVRADLVSAQTMPFDTGDMQNNQTFVHADESGASLVTGSPQARRLYYHPEYHFRKTITLTQVRLGLNHISQAVKRTLPRTSLWQSSKRGQAYDFT